MSMKRFILFLMFLITLPLALGALQVSSFSCDSSVAVGGNLNCQAEITDPSGSSTISSVTLYLPLGDEWAEYVSYTGTGYKSSISQDETTTATFSITPVIAGEHGFDYIKINDIVDTNFDYPAVTINVMSIKSLDINAPSKVSSGAEFTVSSSVLAGGNLVSVQITISINSGGCTLGTGESPTKSLGSMSDGTQGSKSWILNQGSSGCSFTITATASGGLSRSVSASVGVPTGGTTGGGGGAKPKIVLLANSIDLNLSKNFTSFLENNGIDIIHVNALNFSQYKTEKFLVILGGPDAYEGVGNITREVLTEIEQEQVRARGSRMMYVKTNVWANGQVVMVIAGSNRELTMQSGNDNKEAVISRVKG
jgi:hypothetical protein